MSRLVAAAVAAVAGPVIHRPVLLAEAGLPAVAEEAEEAVPRRQEITTTITTDIH